METYASPQWRGLAASSNEEDFRAFHAEFIRRLPIEMPLHTTAKPWFIHQLRVIAHTIQDTAEHPSRGSTAHDSAPSGSG